MFPLLSYIFGQRQPVVPPVVEQVEQPQIREVAGPDGWVNIKIDSEVTEQIIVQHVKSVSFEEQSRMEARRRKSYVKNFLAIACPDEHPSGSGNLTEIRRGTGKNEIKSNGYGYGGNNFQGYAEKCARFYGDNGPQRKRDRSRKSSGKAVDRKVNKNFNLHKMHFQ